MAAEESSTLYARRILEDWNARELNIKTFGVGNAEMAQLGFENIAQSKEMAVVGLAEIWKHWEKIRATYRTLVKRAKDDKPAFALLLDYPGFNLRLSKDLHKLGIPVIYYISPQLWAWKKGRVNKVKKFVKRMLVLFPFEKDFYQSHDYQADYVGHPLIDEIHPDLLNLQKQLEDRQRFGVQKDEQLLGLMPGSRYGEIRFNLVTQLAAAEILVQKYPKLKVAVLLAPNLKREDLNLPNTNLSLQVIQKEPFEMIGFCDAVLCASGTATLMVGLIEKPMVIMYKVHPFTAWFGRMIVKIEFFGLVNIIARREIAPERFQERATPEELASLLEVYIFDPEKRKKAVQDLRDMKALLGSGGATKKVIHILDEYLR